VLTPSIYEPVEEELARVEEGIRRIADVPGELSHLLDYVLGSSGKRIRPLMVLLGGRLYDYDPERLIPAALATELLHTATLVHDDVVDKSYLRRGKPTVNQRFGNDTALILGDYILAAAGYSIATISSRGISKARERSAVRYLTRAVMDICQSELEETLNAFSVHQSRRTYYRQIRGKTASLFAAAIRIGATLGNAPRSHILALENYGLNLGMGFQIVDDILDFTSDERNLGKPPAQDLRQGKVTLPVLVLGERKKAHFLLREAFATKDEEKLRQIFALAHDESIIKKCYEIALRFCLKAKESLPSLSPSPALRSLKELADCVAHPRTD
jgi:heptaprenyl diphosphate synthase